MSIKTNLHIVILLYLSLSLLLSCAKEEVDIPTISFLSPHANSVFAVGDTVAMRVHITSKSDLKTVEFGLVNDDLIPVGANRAYPQLSGNEMTIDFAIVLNDYFMTGGNYQLHCKVTNQSDVKHKYLPVIISGISQKLEDVVVLTQSGSFIRVWSLGNTLSQAPVLKYEKRSDYSGSAYLPFHNRFAIAGSVQGEMICWDYFANDTVLQMPVTLNPPMPYYTGVAYVNDLLAVSYRQGAVSFYNYLGQAKLSLATQANYYPEKVFDVGSNFIVQQKHISSTNRIVTLHLSTASQHASFNLQGDICDAFPFEGKDFLVFFNGSGQGNIEKYIFDNNGTTKPVSYHGAEFLSAVQQDAYNYYLSTDNQLLWYRYSVSSVSPIVDNVRLEFLCYDPVGGRLFAVNNQQVEVYSVPQGQLLFSTAVSEDIIGMHLIYNK